MYNSKNKHYKDFPLLLLIQQNKMIWQNLILAAILMGVDALGPGDTLLIAGKGPETGQIIGNDVLDFNDVEQASIAVAALDGIAP